jgi:hypothetical protein
MNIVKALVLTGAFGIAAQAAIAGNTTSHETRYSLTITNITHGMLFTPFVAAVHDKSIAFFELGNAPSDELAHIAEAGDIAPQVALLEAASGVSAIATGNGPLFAGDSVTLEIAGSRLFGPRHYLSLAAMMVPTNDTFVALNHVRLPLHGSVTYYAKSYDAGSEINDESCLHVPGPQCGGEAYSPDSDGEGFVFPSPATHGEADLGAARYRWSDPVAKVVISRMR